MASRGRGRGTSGATIKMPNLAMAGKREEKPDAKQAKGTNDRGRGGRGGRGGGRGGRGARGGQRGGMRDRPALIQSEGIFSEGLANLETKKQRREEPAVTFGYDPTESRERMDDDAAAAKTKFEGYDAVWTFDEAEEASELQELVRDGILSDYKRGSILPVVLPRHDEVQFIDLLPNAIKDEILSEGEEEREEALQEMEQDKLKMKKMAINISGTSDPVYTSMKKAGDVLRRLYKEDHEELVILQLPTVLETLSMNGRDEDDMEIEPQLPVKQEPGLSSPLPNSASAQDDTPKDRETARLPRGKKLGKLRVTKKGRVYLEVGGQVIDLTHHSTGSLQEGVVAVESQSDPSPSSGGVFGMTHAQRAREMASRGNDAIYFCGEVKHHLTGSVDWDELRLRSRQEQKKRDEQEEPMDQKPVVPSEAEARELRAQLDAEKKKAEKLSERLRQLTTEAEANGV